MFASHFTFGHTSREPGEVHGVDGRIEDDPVEVPYDDGKGGEDGFVEVNGAGDVEAELGQHTNGGTFEPEEESRHGHEDATPDEGPVFEFFNITKPGITWVFIGKVEIVAHCMDEVSKITRAGQEVAEELPTAWGEGEVGDMPDSRNQHDNPGNPVSKPAPFKHVGAKVAKGFHPPRIRITQHEAGNDQDNKTECQNAVLNTFIDVHAEEVTLCLLLSAGGSCEAMKAHFVAHFLEKIQEVVDEHTAHDEHDRPSINGGDPVKDDIRGSTIRGDVNFALGEAFIGSGMAFTTGFLKIVGVDERLWIVL